MHSFLETNELLAKERETEAAHPGNPTLHSIGCPMSRVIETKGVLGLWQRRQ